MIACLASKCSRCSLLGGLRNNAVSVQSTLQALTSGTFFSQQQRTFIQMGSKLKVVDNSGAKVVKCIKGLGCCKKGARLGDKIVASVREAQPLEVKKGVARKIDAVKKGDVVYCVIVRAAMPKRRFDGSVVRFDDNAVVIINRGEPVGTRVAGPVCHELRKNRHAKILSLAKNVV